MKPTPTSFRSLRLSQLLWISVCCLVTLLCLSDVEAAPVTRSATGANAAAIQATVDTFRVDLGGANNGVGGSFLTGRREINWDGVGDGLAAPANLPADFFNVNSPRGAVFVTVAPGTGFQVSMDNDSPADADPDQIEFDNINATYSASFQTFSVQRLFTPLGGRIIDVTFRSPGTDLPATVKGFGVVFTDVDSVNATGMQFFDQNNASLGIFPASTSNNGLSFLGVSFNAGERVGRVSITCGNTAIGPNDAGAATDVVVMDDFIYAEPDPNVFFLYRWDGGGANNAWMTEENWVNDAVPAAGVRLEFPGGAAQISASNNFPTGTQFFDLLLSGSDYNLDGNAVAFSDGITATNGNGTNIMGIFTILGDDQTFRSTNGGATLRFNAPVELNGHTLTIDGAGDTELVAVIDDFEQQPGVTGGILKNGSGTLTFFSGGNSYSEQTVLNAGTLASDAAAKISALVAIGGVVAPGGVSGTGILTTGSLGFNANAFDVDLNGGSPGSGYDQLKVTGSVSLGGNSTLNLSLGFVPGGHQFVIIQNDGSDAVTGNFNGFLEGHTFEINGEDFVITYQGGDGNDVVLRHIPSTPTPAATLLAVDSNNVLFRFSSTSPGTIIDSVSVTVASGEAIQGIDIRPASGVLYALAVNDNGGAPIGHIYTINQATGASAQVGDTLGFSLGAGAFGFDFNPTNDRLRVVSDRRDNLLIDPDTGAVTPQTDLSESNIVASAYSNNVAGAVSTTLFGISPATDQLVTQDPPASGAITSVGPLNFDNSTAANGFDIAGDGTAFAAFATVDATSGLYTIDLVSGAATFWGNIGGGSITIRGLTALPAATPTPTPTSTVTPTPTATPFGTPTPTATPFGTPPTLANISTRLRVETGDNVLIGGFIITGTQDKKVIVRAIGPSLSLAGALADPTLELYNSSGLLASNDNWRSDQEAEIIDTTIPPTNDLESAIVATLPANASNYTAIVRGAGGGTGIGVVEAYDLDRSVDSKLANISTRGFVQTGDDVLIGGLIVLGDNPLKVIVRAIGPSLPFPGVLADPTLELRDGNGGLLAANDNWRSDQEAEIIATTIPPTNDLESAIVTTLPANNASYTAIVRGAGETTGIAVVEVYALD